MKVRMGRSREEERRRFAIVVLSPPGMMSAVHWDKSEGVRTRMVGMWRRSRMWKCSMNAPCSARIPTVRREDIVVVVD